MADITVTTFRTTLEAPVTVQPRPAISVGVDVPERPELNFDVAVTRPQVSVEVISEHDEGAQFETNLALLYSVSKL